MKKCWLTRRTLAGCRGRYNISFYWHCRLRRTVCLLSSLAEKDAATEENRALLIAITCAITAPLALTADLHQTARVWHFYAWPTPWSWMPWGALFLPLFTGFLALWFLAQQIKRLFNKSYNVTKWLALASALCAVGLLIYTGREVSVVLARPIWFSYAFPVAMFLSALQAFFALMIVAARRDSVRLPKILWGQIWTLAALGLVVAMWVSGDTLSGTAIRQWITVALSAKYYAVGWVALWVCTLLFCSLALRHPLSQLRRVLLVLSALALCWLMRWTLLIQVQTVPKFNAQFNPYSLPGGTDGWLAILGTFGLWIALLIIIRETLNGLTRRLQHG